MKEINIDKLKEQTAQYAIDHVTGRGTHTHIAFLRDSFNKLCAAMGANEWKPEDIGFDLDTVVKALKAEPWVKDIAAKSAGQRTREDMLRIARNFIRKYWSVNEKPTVTLKDVNDILNVINPFSRRLVVANRVSIDCLKKIPSHKIHRLDEILGNLARNPNYGIK